MLIAYNWPQNTDRYRRIAKFIDAFFPRIADFQKAPRHPKWREVNLTATVPGTKDFRRPRNGSGQSRISGSAGREAEVREIPGAGGEGASAAIPKGSVSSCSRNLSNGAESRSPVERSAPRTSQDR